ncbi:MAG: amidohydrolase [Desulfobacteraceae bacterium]|nr:MAG: amidohydrolase [Desulfobacteraceae bacterium]
MTDPCVKLDPSTVASWEQELKRLRRDFHQYPELGFQEFKTQEKILHYLSNHGIPAQKIAGTGVKAILQGTARPDPEKNVPSSKTILLRSDMDALPVKEETGLAFQSTHDGIMHACGHDGHMAMLLKAAAVLSQLSDRFTGNVVLGFQPNEEDAGAYLMVEEGILENPGVDAAFGCHLWSGLDSGKIDITKGPVMAASHYFFLTIKGKGGHAGFAHTSVDPIFIAAQIIQSAQSIQTRQIDALHPAVIMFTAIEGGSTPTIIPGQVEIKGSIRFLYDRGEEILEKFEHLVAGVCQTHGASFELSYKLGNHMLSNSDDMTRLAARSVLDMAGGQDRLVTGTRTMAGEDFSEFSRRVPSAYAFVGSRNIEKNTHFPHHHPCFDIDEDVLMQGAELYIRVALSFLTGSQDVTI